MGLLCEYWSYLSPTSLLIPLYSPIKVCVPMEIGALPKDTAIPKCAPMFMCVVFPEYVPEC